MRRVLIVIRFNNELNLVVRVKPCFHFTSSSIESKIRCKFKYFKFEFLIAVMDELNL